MKKICLFIDADDTILSSSEAVIDILNNKFNINPKKSIEDLKDWCYRSIYSGLEEEDVSRIYDSDEFFEKVKIKEDFLNIYKNYQDYFSFKIVSKGTWENLKKKKDFFKENLPMAEFVGMPLYYETADFGKESIDMDQGIQIDDRCDCLNTNASCKILLKNDKDYEWNERTEDVKGNCYVCNSWKEIEEILRFTIEKPEWLFY